MKKEEVLERSRNEKKDEGKEFIFDQGRKSGVIGMLVIFVILAGFNLYHNHQETNFALIAMFFGYLGCESLGIYRITKKKIELLKLIMGCIVSVSFFVMYLVG